MKAHRPHINRRQFLQLVAATGASLPLGQLCAKQSGPETRSETSPYENLKDPWLSLAEVQQHLLPTEKNAPGARDIHALVFLRNMLNAPDSDAEERGFILKGVDWLNDLSVKNHQQIFRKLSPEKKEKVLRRIETSRAGSRWLSLMMSYLIEALLSDPVYGGNRDGKGWAWLEHQPGFPSPTADKLYYKLGQPPRRRTKS